MMPEGAFTQLVGRLAERPATFAALLAVRDFEAETCRRDRDILSAHARGETRSVIRPLIQAAVARQQTGYVAVMAALQTAMNEEFEESLAIIGGPTFVPQGVDRAWENYVAPIKQVLDAFREETLPLAQAVADIEDEYLFL